MKISTLFLSCFLFFGYVTLSESNELDGTGQSFACTSGDVTSNSAILWFRLDGESDLTIQYSKQLDLKNQQTLKSVSATEKTDYTIKKKINGLEPKTQYYFRGTVNGKKPGPICKFVTAPKQDDLAEIQFAFGGDTRESHLPFKIMDAIRASQPDFFLFLGDTIYADYEGGASSVSGYWGKYKTNRDDEPSQNLFSQTSLYLIWDDHEVENNYEASTSLMPIGRQAFFDYWPITQNLDHPDRMYRSFRWGKAVELFILDTRQYRSIAKKRTILGAQQKKWFLDALSSSNALFKFVATPVPISSGNSDKWGGFLDDKDEVLTYIEENITGVIFLTADVHYAAEARILGYSEELREFIVGPLATAMNEKDRSHYKRFEFFHNDSYNYGFARVFPNAKPPYALIEIRDTENKVLHDTRVVLEN